MHFALCFWHILQTRGIMPMMVLKHHVQKLMHVAICLEILKQCHDIIHISPRYLILQLRHINYPHLYTCKQPSHMLCLLHAEHSTWHHHSYMFCSHISRMYQYISGKNTSRTSCMPEHVLDKEAHMSCCDM